MTSGASSRWVMRAGAPARAELTLIDYRGRVALLKSFDHSAWLFRWSAGRLLTQREAAAYVALDGIRGVPRLLERRGATALVLELVDGRSCFACRADEFDDAFFDRLTALLEQVRSRGVLHGDVKRNVIRGQDGFPWLVDFAASIALLRYVPVLRDRVMRVAAQYDRRAVAKLKTLVAPHLLTEADRRHLDAPPPYASVVKACERVLRGITQWVAGVRNPS
jgi:RIO-like serine/threonine protein kinase